jgi:hypothetical protein
MAAGKMTVATGGIMVDALGFSVTGDGVIVSVEVVIVVGSSTVDVNASAVNKGVVKLVDTETVVGV